MKRLLTLSALGMLALPAAAVAAPDGAKLYAEKTCIACHGPKGNKPLLPNYPKVAGQNAAYAEQQMKDIKSGARANAQSVAMAGVMHLVNDEEIKALAVWLESLQ
ncbi:MAG: c-type cytochrome [Betaproteobacteria bacterium]|nr:c-type cytochrome [Betaproteobacteria bacterium]